MNNIQKHSDKTFEDVKHINEYGAEYWLARELAPVLEYTQWRNFLSVVEKAVEACVNSGFNVNDHFADVSKMIDLPKGAKREIDFNIFLLIGLLPLSKMRRKNNWRTGLIGNHL